MSYDMMKEFKKYIPVFQQAHDQAMNESDTSMRISKFCEEVLGMTFLTTYRANMP